MEDKKDENKLEYISRREFLRRYFTPKGILFSLSAAYKIIIEESKEDKLESLKK